MDNYGKPISDKNSHLIGYYIEDTQEYASIKTFYNNSYLLCNKVEKKEFDTETLSFKVNR